jgi:ornithine--oxo-acid transaminase
MKDLIEEYITSSAHLSKKHVHPRMMKMLEMAGMVAVFKRGEGQYLYDTEDNRYLDLLAGGGVFFLGRNHPRIREALTDVLSMDLPNLSIVNASVLGGLLAERLINLAGEPFAKVVFANSGAEANEVCIRFSRYLTRRRRYLYLEGAFHGRTYGAISLCGFPEMKEAQDPLMPVCTPLRRNDLAQLRRELARGDVAALFIEAVQGMTCEVTSPGFLREAQNLCEQHGTVLVMDEVQTGLGRCGSWFASHEAGIRPGMLTVSKTLAGGQVPVSAVLLSQDIYERVYAKFKAGPIYFSTFAENNLAMAAGIATLDVLREIDAPTRARQIGDRFRDGLRNLAEKHDVIDRVVGKGLMIAVYFKDSADIALKVQQSVMGAADAGAFAAAVNVDMYSKQRVIVQIPGPGLNAIKILPPVIITEEDIQRFIDALDETLSAYYEANTGPVVALSSAVVKDAVQNVRKYLPAGLRGKPEAHDNGIEEKKNVRQIDLPES